MGLPRPQNRKPLHPKEPDDETPLPPGRGEALRFPCHQAFRGLPPIRPGEGEPAYHQPASPSHQPQDPEKYLQKVDPNLRQTMERLGEQDLLADLLAGPGRREVEGLKCLK